MWKTGGRRPGRRVGRTDGESDGRTGGRTDITIPSYVPSEDGRIKTDKICGKYKGLIMIMAQLSMEISYIRTAKGLKPS